MDNRSNLFVNPLLPKLQTKNANRLEYAFPAYVKNVLLTECAITLFNTNTLIINFKSNILQTSAHAQKKNVDFPGKNKCMDAKLKNEHIRVCN